MQLLRIENDHYHAHSFLWKKKNCPQNFDRIQKDRRETLLLPEGSLSCRHRQVRKARKMKMLNFRRGSSRK